MSFTSVYWNSFIIIVKVKNNQRFKNVYFNYLWVCAINPGHKHICDIVIVYVLRIDKIKSWNVCIIFLLTSLAWRGTRCCHYLESVLIYICYQLWNNWTIWKQWSRWGGGGGGGIPLTGLTPPHFCVYPKPVLGFPTACQSYLSSMFWDESWLFVMLILVIFTFLLSFHNLQECRWFIFLKLTIKK